MLFRACPPLEKGVRVIYQQILTCKYSYDWALCYAKLPFAY